MRGDDTFEGRHSGGLTFLVIGMPVLSVSIVELESNKIAGSNHPPERDSWPTRLNNGLEGARGNIPSRRLPSPVMRATLISSPDVVPKNVISGDGLLPGVRRRLFAAGGDSPKSDRLNHEVIDLFNTPFRRTFDSHPDFDRRPEKSLPGPSAESKSRRRFNYRTFKPGATVCSAPDLWSDQGLRVPVRQVQAHEVQGRHLRKVRRGSSR